MEIEELAGTDSRLYELVAPLVMKPSVLRQNNNYPFKTSHHYIWFVATEDERVSGFMPVEIRDSHAIINNYYIVGDNMELLSSLIKKTIKTFEDKYKVISVTQTRHVSTFEENGFHLIREWKQYVKMERSKNDKKEKCI